MTDRTLVGFVSELRGNESYLLDATPVLRLDGVPHIVEGTRPPRRIQEYEVAEYTWPLPAAPHGVGDIVWLAGPTCIGNLTTVLPLAGAAVCALVEVIIGWPQTHQMFRWTTGPADMMRALVEPAVLELQDAAGLHLRAGNLDSTAKLLDALTSIERRDSHTSLLLVAAHYQAAGDTTRAASAGRQAVRDRHARTVASFLRMARRKHMFED